jgi:outer membrane receptor protein involved in Fe transport
MRRDVKAIIWLLSFFLFTSYSVFAQGSFGSIKGTVSDTAGAAVSGATVEIKNQDTNETRSVTTGSQGEFIVNNLNVGSYSIIANSQGFSTTTAKDVRVSVAFVTEHNVTLNAAGSEATVTVTTGDTATQINTSDQQLSTIIGNQKIQDLPLLSRDPSSLVLLAPGTVQTDSALGGFSINGSRERNNNFMVDGVDNNDTDVPGIPGGVATPNIDATEEFRVITGNFNAEYGRNTGGIITTATKRGTNDFHGNAYLYWRSDRFAARNFFDDTGKADPLDRRQYGGSFGGPVWKDKLFFFFNYEGNRSSAGGPQYRAVPTAAARTGVFTTPVYGTLDLRQGSPNNGVDLPFNPTALQLLSLYPLPNYPTNGAITSPLPGLFEIYTFTYTAKDKVDSIAARTDWRVNDKHTLTFSANYGVGDFSFGAPTFDTFNDELRTPQKGGVYSLNLLSTFGSTMINELRVGTNRVNAAFNGPGDGSVDNSINDAVASAFTSTGVAIPTFGNPNARALNLVTNFTSIGNFSTQNRITGTTTIGDSFTWSKGDHTLKFGGEARLVYSNGESNFSRQETIDFNFLTYFDPSFPFALDNMGNILDGSDGFGDLVTNYLSFLTGFVANQSQTQFFNKDGQRVENDRRRYRTNEYGFFVQDSWRVRPDLTFNLGVRYDYNTTPYEKDGLLSNLVNNDPSLPTPAGGFQFITVGRNSDNPDIPLWEADKNNFAPRVGFAYSPSFKDGLLGKVFGGPGKSSIRGGFGIFYDRVFTNLFSNTSANPPFSLSISEFPTDTLDFVGRLGTATPTNVANNGDELAVVLFPTIGNNQLQRSLDMPSSQSWNLGFQRDLGGDFLIEADYVGNKGVHLLRLINANMTSISRRNALTGTTFVTSSSLRTNYLRGSLNTAFGQGASSAMNISTGNSEYNAMQLRVTKTLTNSKYGLGQLQAHYTWGHSIDDAPDALNTGAGDRSLPRDSSGYIGGLYAERGDSSFDARHRFVFNFIYEMPFFRGTSLRDKVLGNWVISGIFQGQTGYPISIFANGVDVQGTGLSGRASFNTRDDRLASNHTQANDRIYTGPDRALFLGSPCVGNNPNNPASISGCTILGVPFAGTVGRSTFRGPKFSKFDFSLIKRFPINETMRFTLRADFFNLFNNVNLSVPITDVTDPGYGLSTAAGAARIVQFAGRFDF